MTYREIVRVSPICYAHQLHLPYVSPCNQLHGHNAEVEVVISAPALNAEGMVIDFTEIKDMVKQLDHATLGRIFDKQKNEVFFTKHFPEIEPSTAENIARALLQRLTAGIQLSGAVGVIIEEVSVWETPSSKVTVRSTDV